MNIDFSNNDIVFFMVVEYDELSVTNFFRFSRMYVMFLVVGTNPKEDSPFEILLRLLMLSKTSDYLEVRLWNDSRSSRVKQQETSTNVKKKTKKRIFYDFLKLPKSPEKGY